MPKLSQRNVKIESEHVYVRFRGIRWENFILFSYKKNFPDQNERKRTTAQNEAHATSLL